jgi:hypothetical protein
VRQQGLPPAERAQLHVSGARHLRASSAPPVRFIARPCALAHAGQSARVGPAIRS